MVSFFIPVSSSFFGFLAGALFRPPLLLLYQKKRGNARRSGRERENGKIDKRRLEELFRKTDGDGVSGRF